MFIPHSNSPSLYSQWLNFILQQITGRKREVLSGAVLTSFVQFADVSLRFYDIRRCKSFLSRQKLKKCIQITPLESKLLAGFLYVMAENLKNLKDTITFSSFSIVLESK